MSDFRARVAAAVEEIRPVVQMDGGDVEILNVDEAARVVKLGLLKACAACPPEERAVLVRGIDKALRASVPEVAVVSFVP